MGINTREETKRDVAASSLIDDKSGTNVGYFAANARNVTSLIGQITQTSPGAIQSMSGTPLSLPGNAVPISMTVFGKLGASTALATITVGLDTTTNYFLSTSVSNVSGGGVGLLIPRETAQLYAALAGLPVGQGHTVTGSYSEAGTSGSGGPWFVEIDFFVQDPA